jgi:hypothetical protein
MKVSIGIDVVWGGSEHGTHGYSWQAPAGAPRSLAGAICRAQKKK